MSTQSEFHPNPAGACPELGLGSPKPYCERASFASVATSPSVQGDGVGVSTTANNGNFKKNEEIYAQNPAKILALLIRRGLATEIPDRLPPEWRVGYEAVLAMPDRNFLERAAAFQQAVADNPACHIMAAEIEDAHNSLENAPPGQERIYAAWETLHSAPPVSEPVVDGIFNPSSVNLIAGAPGTKKTWLALDLAVSVASGQPWLGHSTASSVDKSQFEIRNSTFENSSPLSTSGERGRG
ncbi:MAG: AAA family ATPase [Chloroflexi bacterium]|nr:AAA family ATPase [Chloroflexota bacterium]